MGSTRPGHPPATFSKHRGAYETRTEESERGESGEGLASQADSFLKRAAWHLEGWMALRELLGNDLSTEQDAGVRLSGSV